MYIRKLIKESKTKASGQVLKENPALFSNLDMKMVFLGTTEELKRLLLNLQEQVSFYLKLKPEKFGEKKQHIQLNKDFEYLEIC